MYKDRAEVKRAVLVTDGNTDDYTTEYKIVYSGLPCKLSQYGKTQSAARGDVATDLTTDLRLTYDPQVEILPNDYVQVQHCGQMFNLFAGEVFKYPTHCELSLRRHKQTGQN